MITDDLKKTNMQVCKFIEDLFFEYDAQHLAEANSHLQHLVIFSDCLRLDNSCTKNMRQTFHNAPTSSYFTGNS